MAAAGVLGGVHRDVGVADEVVAVGRPARVRDDPMLAPTVSSRPEIVTGSPSFSFSRSATSMASSSPAESSSTANSSPPSRASVSLGRTAAEKRSATARSSWSPASWPRLSFTCLKPSRSTSSTASGDRARSERATRLVEPVAEQGAVREGGEAVVERLPGQLLLEPHALGHVARVQHDAAQLPVVAQVGHVGVEVPPLPEAVQHAEHDLARLAARAGGLEHGLVVRVDELHRTCRPAARARCRSSVLGTDWLA